MIKVSFFSGDSERGPVAVPLFTSADVALEKYASTSLLLPDVVRYIDSLRPSPDAQYILVNALGAGEYFGSNINGDYFTEASLIHRPDDWTGNPLIDKIRARDWPYGFPTFYYAHPFAHHRNKDTSKAFGEVELAVWNDRMKRVELVLRMDKDKCLQHGGVQVWDRLKAGQYPDVSMGCKVPFDTCSICLDWKKYRQAQASFDPKKQKSPGEAVLAIHKQNKIRGVSITRADYCEHAKKMNLVLPDGRKHFVYNDYPKFFDISVVFIGADKTAKVMMKIAGVGARSFWDIGSSAELAEKLGYAEEPEIVLPRLEKNASIDDDILKLGFLGKDAKLKRSEIIKDVVPSQFSGKAVPVLTSSEKDLPDELLETMSKLPLEKSLSTSGALGMVLRPREFQRVILIRIGQRPLANSLDAAGEVFPHVEDHAPMQLGPEDFVPSLAKLLLPLLASRSALAPAIEHRVLTVSSSPEKKKKASSSHPSLLLSKISAAYNSYRKQLMDLAVHAQPLIAKTAYQADLLKMATAAPAEVFSPLSVAYLKTAFLDEVGPGAEGGEVKQARADVERGTPLKEHVKTPLSER
jgi:hypothetical protein